MKIKDVIAFPISYPLPPEHRVSMGIGQAIKRDAVIVKITTDEGISGYGEAHHGRAPGAVAHLINTTMRELVLNMNALETIEVWKKMYRMQLASHGMGAAAAIAMSGIDIALWDIRGKVLGWPLYRILGGTRQEIQTYAGGVSLGFQKTDSLVDEIHSLKQLGHQAIKLRIGDRPDLDLERVKAVRKTFGNDLKILTDVNTAYSLEDARKVMPVLESEGVGWIEEPFPPHDYRSYSIASKFSTLPIAAGENHYTRFEYIKLIEEGIVQILQPDISKTGGITEAIRISAMASAWKLPINPHSSMTGLNMAATIHLLASIENAGYFEADVSHKNPFRDQLVSTPYKLSSIGTVIPLDKPGIGVEVDQEFITKHPVIEGPSYV